MFFFGWIVTHLCLAMSCLLLNILWKVSRTKGVVSWPEVLELAKAGCCWCLVQAVLASRPSVCVQLQLLRSWASLSQLTSLMSNFFMSLLTQSFHRSLVWHPTFWKAVFFAWQAAIPSESSGCYNVFYGLWYSKHLVNLYSLIRCESWVFFISAVKHQVFLVFSLTSPCPTPIQTPSTTAWQRSRFVVSERRLSPNIGLLSMTKALEALKILSSSA